MSVIRNLGIVLSCPICFNTYNEQERIPITLKCKHHLCKDCAEKLLKNQTITCPKCRRTTETESIDDFQRDYGKVFKEILEIYSSQLAAENDKSNEPINDAKCEGENFTNIKKQLNVIRD